MEPRSIQGLTNGEALERRRRLGANEIEREASSSAWTIFASQFRSPVVGLLAVAGVLSVVLGEVADGVAIGTIVFLNALVGFFQEYRAEKAVHALRAMTAPRARVIRGGKTEVIAAVDVVPGDVLSFEAGDLIAADAKLLEAHELNTNEAALTGESAPVHKKRAQSPAEAPLAERHDWVFMGTAVATGTGLAEVVNTGMQTELGKIAHLLTTAQESQTPLQRRLARVSRSLILICIGIVVVTALAGFARGVAPLEVLLSAVSLAVAAVPEGLPAVVTIALAIGVQRMASRHVFIRKLPAVETLGSATVICTDKTGTLTTGIMVVRELWGPDHAALLRAAAGCCDAELGEDERSGTGDPTEVALLMAAAERGIRRPDIEASLPRTLVHPFDSDRKRMSIQRSDGQLYVKGGVEAMLSVSSVILPGLAEAHEQMAARGLRVLAVGLGSSSEERDLTLLGVVGISDPPRTEAIEAVRSAREAGIKTVMITGDHPVTARAIARELGILQSGDRAEEAVHARATPEEKLRIVRDWKSRNAVVAMTGDGVNDAPALREAHIGIAMGKAGTEVTREASDMVLADDNFASIIAAVREGRGIFDNIRKTLVYLLAGNVGELMVMLAAAIVGLPLPLLPLHLLWINLVTDGLPAVALVMDPPDPDVLKRPPRSPHEAMLGAPEWRYILLTGVLQSLVTLGVFVWALQRRDVSEARNLAFSTLVFGEVLRAFAARSRLLLFWEVGAFTNVRLLGVVVLSFFLQLGLHHIPATQALFELHDLSVADCALSIGVGLIPVTVLELSKLLRRAIDTGM